MTFASIMFYLFAALTVFSGVMVVSSRNPVHSVLFLIFAFFNAAGLFLLIGAEYIAMTLIIVYVGAVGGHLPRSSYRKPPHVSLRSPAPPQGGS